MLRPFASLAWVAGCLALAGLGALPAATARPAPVEPAQPTLATAFADAAATTPRARTLPIAQVRCGEWVLSGNPELDSRPDSLDITPPDWRLVTLRHTHPSGDIFDIVLLRPQDWLAQERGEVGRTIDLRIDEQGIDGPCQVLDLRPCPELARRPSAPHRLVTGTFTHHRRVYDLRVSGEPEPIGTTDNHPFWSEDRDEFVHAASLESGERLRLPDGRTAAVESGSYRGTIERVYNLEVQGEHTYYVGHTGILVHNMCANPSRFISRPDGTVVDLGPTLERIRNGVRHPHRNDGSVFGNREGLLPSGTTYREYVHPTPGLGRRRPGAQRIVIGADGTAYYTPDHYSAFIPIVL